jgi:hypothetical protein
VESEKGMEGKNEMEVKSQKEMKAELEEEIEAESEKDARIFACCIEKIAPVILESLAHLSPNPFPRLLAISLPNYLLHFPLNPFPHLRSNPSHTFLRIRLPIFLRIPLRLFLPIPFHLFLRIPPFECPITFHSC